MNLRAYQEWLVNEQWNGYPLRLILDDAVAPGSRLSYRALKSLYILTNGIGGEVGEAKEHFKKWVRDGRMNRTEAGIELGDVLAYLTWLTATLGYTLEDIAKMNHDKLAARSAAGTGATAA